MNIIFIETPEFIKKIDVLVSEDDFLTLQKELIENPLRGKIIKGTGGARKIRMKVRGRGKSGGARTIYYYVDFKGEVWFLDVYLKNEKSKLTEKDKSSIYHFIKEIINEER